MDAFMTFAIPLFLGVWIAIASIVLILFVER